MRTAYGIVSDECGFASNGGRYWATPAAQIRSVQNSVLPIDRDHDRIQVGAVVDLQRHGGNVWCVAEVADHISPSVAVKVGTELRHVAHDLFWSASWISSDSGYLYDSVALTAMPARISARPVRFRDGDVHRAAYQASDPFEKRLLKRASEAKLKRHGGAIIIEGEPDTDHAVAIAEGVPATAPIEYRSAELADVSYTDRLIEIIAAPYNVWATVAIQGRKVEESFANTAFANVNKQENRRRIRVWRDHDPVRAVGRIIDLNPFDPAGLIAQFRISKTREGDETLELARDGVIDASVGFGVKAERWEGRSRRTVTRAWLDHLGLTSAPAYDGTHVLAVR